MKSIIQTVNLTRKFGDFVANNNISLDIKEGEIRCIVGENGAGKSTLMNMLYGLLAPSSGQILIRGQEVKMNSPLTAIGVGIGMVHQHFKASDCCRLGTIMASYIIQKEGCISNAPGEETLLNDFNARFKKEVG